MTEKLEPECGENMKDDAAIDTIVSYRLMEIKRSRKHGDRLGYLD